MLRPVARVVLISLPVFAVGGPFLVAWASAYLEGREERQRLQNLARVQAMPDVVVDSTEYDFGVMDPGAKGSHTFVIRNTGGGVLEINPEATRGNPTHVELTKRSIPPGESGEVRVTWTTGRKDRLCEIGVRLDTNEPGERTIDLLVKGQVRVQIGAEPPQIVVPPVEPDATSTASTVVYSEVWPSFSVAEATCSIAGATCTVSPADTESLRTVNGTAGYAVSVCLPANLPSGPFQGVVRLRAKDDPTALEHELLEVPISGRVQRRLALYGTGVQENSVLDLGILPIGRGLQRRLVLKVRDPERTLKLRESRIVPDFVRVAVTPYDGDPAGNLYHLDIVVPPEAPEGCWLGQELGELKLVFDHPRIKDLTLRLALAVRGSS
jgi:hypothetical protein